MISVCQWDLLLPLGKVFFYILINSPSWGSCYMQIQGSSAPHLIGGPSPFFFFLLGTLASPGQPLRQTHIHTFRPTHARSLPKACGWAEGRQTVDASSSMGPSDLQPGLSTCLSVESNQRTRQGKERAGGCRPGSGRTGGKFEGQFIIMKLSPLSLFSWI